MESLNIYPLQALLVANRRNGTPTVPESRHLFKAEFLKNYADNALRANGKMGYSPYYELIWVIEGSAMIEVDSRIYELKDNLVVHFSPGQSYRLVAGKFLTGYRVSFSREFLYMTGAETSNFFFEANRSNNNLFNPLKVSADLQVEMQELLHAMVKEYANNFEFKYQILKGLLKIFLIYYTRLSREINPLGLPAAETDFFRRFTNLVKEHFTSKKTVADYASDLHLTQNGLNEIIKKVSGHTASYHIQQHILHEAKRLAICSGMSMKQIAYQLGFVDIGHFSKFFKNKSGMNFTDFKKEMI